MNFNKYVAALEISSSKVVGVVGVEDSGHLNIIATDQEKSVESVRYGHIQNLEDTSNRVARVLARLERAPGVAPRRIGGVYVGLSGRSLRNIVTTVSLTLPEDTEVNDEILERLRSQALATSIDSSLTVIDAVPCTYKIGTQETPNPKGVIGNRIEGTYNLIVCRPSLIRNITRTLPEKLGIRIEGFVVTALATANVILTDEEQRLGCMLVDMGAETTSVSIYKGGCLRYFVTLPLGGRNITRDITSLHQLEERSEEIKIQSGTAIMRETSSSLNIHGLKLADVHNLIVARAEEIVANVVEQITYADMKEKDLPGGIVLIGGAAYLNSMNELLERQSGLSVRMGRNPAYIRIDAPATNHNNLIEVTAVAYAGATRGNSVCLEEPEKEELPVTGEANRPDPEGTGTGAETGKRPSGGERGPQIKAKGNKLFGYIRDKMANMFGTEDDESDLLDD